MNTFFLIGGNSDWQSGLDLKKRLLGAGTR
jgi:hypothetical protein